MPEPSDQERRAILDALEAEGAASEEPSPWRVEALRGEEDQATAPPRNNRGAARA